MDIANICGNEQAKRAIEVAAVNNTPIEFIGTDEALQLFLAAMPFFSTESPWVSLRTVKPCPCGNFGDENAACACTPEEIREHWQQNANNPIAISVKTSRPPTEKIIETLRGKAKNETTKEVVDRISQAQKQPEPTNIQDGAWQLFSRAISHFHMSQWDAKFVLDVGKSIARLARSAVVEPSHIAEALQYRRELP